MSDMRLLKDIADLKRRVARLEAQDKFEFEPWTAFTPELYGSTTDGTITYLQQVAFYALIDGIVIIYGRISVNTIPVAPTGNLRIRTLPYVSPNSLNNPHIPMFGRANLSAGYTAIGGNLLAASTDIALTQSGDDLLQSYPAANLTTSFDVRFEGFYRIS